MNQRIIAALAALCALAMPTGAMAKGKWVRAFTSSLWEAKADQAVNLDNQTIRAPVRIAAGGTSLRLRLGNDFSAAPLRIGGASIKAADGRIVRVTFNGGNAGALIPVSAPLISDPVALPVKAFDVVHISVHLPEKVALSGIHADRGDPTLISPAGDHTGAETFVPAAKTPMRPLIAGVDVDTKRPRPVIVAFGDSITDNAGCAVDAPTLCNWSDVLAQRLAKSGKRHVVVNQGIGGNRLFTPSVGQSAMARFDRDVLAIPHVSHVVFLEGINDLRAIEQTGIGPDELINVYRQLIARAHEHGIKAIGMTVLPFAGSNRYSAESDAARARLNEWIRTSRAFDAVVDLDKVIADPANPAAMLPAYDSGDHLHPGPAGEIAMGEAIPLTLFD